MKRILRILRGILLALEIKDWAWSPAFAIRRQVTFSKSFGCSKFSLLSEKWDNNTSHSCSEGESNFYVLMNKKKLFFLSVSKLLQVFFLPFLDPK